MNLFKSFKERRKKNKNDIETRSIIREYYGNNYQLFLWNYSQNIYNIPEIRIAINTVAEYFSTMPIYHKVINEKGFVQKITKGSDDINYVLGFKPNPIQNAISFWQSCITQLLLNNNLFIEPIYTDEGKLKDLYPLPFKTFELVLENNNAYVIFNEEQSREKHNLKNLIYLSRFCGLNGGKENDLGLYESVIQAMNQQILNSCNPKKVKALISGKMPTGQLKQEDKKGATEELKVNFDNNVNGIAYLDEKWQITPVNWNENDVNKDLKQTVINTVFNYFGLSEGIINHKATEFELETFISRTLKPLADQFEKELSVKLFTQREFEVGHRIEFDVFALSIATLQAKTSFFSIASRNGIANLDEMRSMIGLPPLPDGLGQTFRVSADCVDIRIADKYQLGKLGMTEEKESQANNEVVSTTEKVEDIDSKKEESNAGDSKKGI